MTDHINRWLLGFAAAYLFLLPTNAVRFAHSIAFAGAGLLAVVAFVAGLCIAPALTIVTLLVSSYAPSRYATEAFTWSATCIVSGIGAGNALGGYLIEHFGSSATFATSALTAFAAVGCTSLLFMRGPAMRG